MLLSSWILSEHFGPVMFPQFSLKEHSTFFENRLILQLPYRVKQLSFTFLLKVVPS